MGRIREKCQLFTPYQNLNKILTFRSYNCCVVMRGRDLQKLDCQSLQRRGSTSVCYSPIAPELLWRETEVIGQTTARIWGTRPAKCRNQSLAALIPKGGE